MVETTEIYCGNETDDVLRVRAMSYMLRGGLYGFIQNNPDTVPGEDLQALVHAAAQILGEARAQGCNVDEVVESFRADFGNMVANYTAVAMMGQAVGSA